MPHHDYELLTIEIEEGEVVGAGSWVYVWVRREDDRRAIYVGATGMDPTTRAWLHVHHDDPAIGRVLAHYRGATSEPLKVFALRVPEEISRQTVRTAVATRLGEEDLLSPHYFGDRPLGQAEVPTKTAPLVDTLVGAVARHTSSQRPG